MNREKNKVLIVSKREENTQNFADAESLNGDYYLYSKSIHDAQTVFTTEKPDIVFCDLIVEGGDAPELLHRLTKPRIPIGFLFCVTASEEQSYAENSVLKEGADDFIKTPCSPKILSRKISALSRRLNKTNGETTINITDNVSMHLDGHTVTVNEKTITLPRREFAVLRLFAENPGIIYSREDIRKEVWQEEAGLNPRTVDVHIYNLRNKTLPGIIQTVQGKGYVFKKQQEELK